MPRKVTLTQAERLARAKAPELWDSLSAQQRKELVAMLNDHAVKSAAGTDLEVQLRASYRPLPARRKRR